MSAVIKVREVVEIPVCGQRLQLGYILVRFEFKFAHFVIVLAHAEIDTLEKAVEFAQSTFEIKTVTALFQKLEIQFIWFNRQAVPSPIERIIERQPTSAWKPTRATLSVAAACIRISDRAQRRAIVASFLSAAVRKQHQAADAKFESGAAARVRIATAAKRRDVA